MEIWNYLTVWSEIDSWHMTLRFVTIVTKVNPMILHERINSLLNEHGAYPYPQEESKLESILQNTREPSSYLYFHENSMNRIRKYNLSMSFGCANHFDTWKRVKWIKKRISWGRPNQNNSFVGCTIGAPSTTTCLSWISKAISVIITCSFAPTNKTICAFWG